ncbi:MAG: hypothetical protein Q7S92_01605, partial [Candidatus Diapherotrites archaeon]|nr:hypothetical protein [Candidatus Diapherotrites archaeon]
LKHISESAEAIDSRSLDMITSLQVGEALMIGEAVRFPLFFRVRRKKSPQGDNELTLEESAKQFEELTEKVNQETESYL